MLQQTQVSRDDSALDQKLQEMQDAHEKQIQLENQIALLQDRVDSLSKNSPASQSQTIPSDTSSPKVK